MRPSGKRILLLERGGWLPRELENWDAEAVFVQNRYVPKETWYDKNNKPFQPGVHYWVGGATKLYGAALYRLRKEDFGELQHYDGISPAWPIGYQDMEPYYTQAEQLYQVHGARGEDPTEPPASAPYPFPALRTSPASSRSPTTSARAGYHPFHTPNGVLLNEAEPQFGKCIRCQTCDGFPCLLGAKSDAEVIAVRPALDYPNVTLLTDAQVVKLNTDPSGKTVTEVMVDQRGEQLSYKADIVVLSCGAANSAKVLLQSANDQHRNGLANGSDQVGRNYMFHASIAMLAVSREPNPTKFQKTLGFNDFYFGMPDFAYPMGNIQMVGKSTAPMYKGEKPMQTRLAPMFSLDYIASHAVDFWLSTEDLPKPRQPGDGRGRRQHRARLHADERGPQAEALRQAALTAEQPADERAPGRAQHVHEERHRDRRGRPSGRDVSLRHRSEDVRAGHQLQGARAGQPVCGGYQLLPQHRRRQSGADGHGQRAARGRPPPTAPGVGEASSDDGRPTRDRRRLPGRHGAGGGAGHVPAGEHHLSPAPADGWASSTSSCSGLSPTCGRFWLFAGFALLYGVVKPMNGNWASLYMTADIGPTATVARLALTAFWGMVTIAASLAGYLIACYQTGYGIAAFGVAPLQRFTGLNLREIYGLVAIVALGMAALSFVVTPRRPTEPATAAPRLEKQQSGG